MVKKTNYLHKSVRNGTIPMPNNIDSSFPSPKCIVCGKEDSNFHPGKQTICPYCTLYLAAHPRYSGESIEEWKVRISQTGQINEKEG